MIRFGAMVAGALALAGMSVPAAAAKYIRFDVTGGIFGQLVNYNFPKGAPAQGMVTLSFSAPLLATSAGFGGPSGYAGASLDKLIIGLDYSPPKSSIQISSEFAFKPGATTPSFSNALVGTGFINYAESSPVSNGVPYGGQFFSGSGAVTITATEFDNDNEFAVFDVAYGLIGLTTVPEPATWALFLVGFGAVGLGVRRSQHRSSLSCAD